MYRYEKQSVIGGKQLKLVQFFIALTMHLQSRDPHSGAGVPPPPAPTHSHSPGPLEMYLVHILNFPDHSRCVSIRPNLPQVTTQHSS